ncbi:macro domain-containing protein [Thalassotalea mangrovi]|uniref:Macro domain-containing protein n=1 Tax=Thalassotalea mangrovi TaxID=2572245 RepID=A0A4V5NUM1_9GAMM|nr:macro domain-containing protein [Thalassotalea mangrovi]TKB47051.1 macro domain-containing protein [Thalassotalea mangrovi]
MGTINIIQGDITTAKVDAIVNAANPRMLGGGGVDAAIHRAAGPELLSVCKKVPAINGIRCPFGEARITSAGNLAAKYVIHTAGPIYQSDKTPQQTLAASYQNALTLALDHHCKSIAFPAISCGIYGYPIEEAAEIAIDVCQRPDYSGLNIQFYLFNDAIMAIWNRELISRGQSC